MAQRRAAGSRKAKGKPKPPDVHTFLRGLASHEPAPVYLLTGNEGFFRDRVVRALRFKLFGREAPASVVQELRGKRAGGDAPVEPAGLIDDLRAGSLFDSTRLVRVAEARPLVDKGADLLLAYLEQPAPGVHLVLECESIDGRTRIGKALAAGAVTIDCRRPFDHPPPWQQGAEPWDHPLAAWVVAEGALQGLRLRKPVAHLLTQRVGNEPGLLSRECQRLAAVLGGTRKAPQELTETSLDALVPDTRGEDLFRLGDAVAGRDTAAALKICDALFRDGIPERSGARTRDANAVAIRALGWTVRTLRELWVARSLLDARAGAADVARALGKKPVFAEQLCRRARRFDAAEFAAWWPRLLAADIGLKTGAPPRLTLEATLAGMLRTPERPAPWRRSGA